jgi:hypothetical protein
MYKSEYLIAFGVELVLWLGSLMRESATRAVTAARILFSSNGYQLAV